MLKSMLLEKSLYESRIGNFMVLAHVFAIGKGESVRNSMCGKGMNPAGGTEAKPVA